MEETTRASRKNVAIIGAGISGLTAAWELSKSDCAVTVYEKDATPGGLAGWFDIGGASLEKFYHHIYNQDADLIEFISELGLFDRLVYRTTTTGCFYVNQIYRLSSPLDLLKYKPLKMLDRIRLGMLAFRARFIKDWHVLDRVSAKDWIIRNAGENVYKVLWEPLFRSKFGKYSSEVSAAWLWSKLVQRGGSRSKSGAEELVYFKGGYGVLFNHLTKALTERGVHIHFNHPVDKIMTESGQVRGLVVNGRLEYYNAVLATAQIPDYLKCAIDLPEAEKRNLQSIGFLGNACLVMRLKQRLSNTYWLNVTDADCPFVGVIEQTNLLDESHYGGNHLAYISRYMDTEDPLYRMSSSELFAIYYPYLKKIFPAFDKKWVSDIYLWREQNAQAIVSVGFGEKIPSLKSAIQGLYLSTMAQIFPEDRQMSNGVKFAKLAARTIMRDLKMPG